MSPRSPFRHRGSSKRLRETRMDRKTIRTLWIGGVALAILLLWVLPWFAEHLPAH